MYFHPFFAAARRWWRRRWCASMKRSPNVNTVSISDTLSVRRNVPSVRSAQRVRTYSRLLRTSGMVYPETVDSLFFFVAVVRVDTIW